CEVHMEWFACLPLLVLFSNVVQPQEMWRGDLQCGWNFKLDNGKPSACNPDGEHPCCSPNGWCGKSEAHCGCSGCKNYRRERCGSKAFTVYNEAATCDPASSNPCCSEDGLCGRTEKHCKHMDYRCKYITDLIFT
ncbi:unnamed protein product, partial [Meganyctiphanes norvegica]